MTESLWNGFRRLDFTFEGREATLVVPDKANDNKNWLFKTEYFHAFPEFEAEMVKRGWHLAYIKNIKDKDNIDEIMFIIEKQIKKAIKMTKEKNSKFGNIAILSYLFRIK